MIRPFLVFWFCIDSAHTVSLHKFLQGISGYSDEIHGVTAVLLEAVVMTPPVPWGQTRHIEGLLSGVSRETRT